MQPYIGVGMISNPVVDMYKRAQKPIYGVCSRPACDMTAMIASVASLEELTHIVLNVVDTFFPATSAYARLIGEMTAQGSVSPILFVRLYWSRQHPGKKFTNSEYEQLELIDIYLQFGLDWKEDYLLTMRPDSATTPCDTA